MASSLDWLAGGLAFVTASGFTLLELITSKYPQTFFLLKNSKFLYLYGAIYGAIAAAVFALLPSVSVQVQMSGVGVANPWIRAFAVGLTAKAFLHIRLFDVHVGPNKSFPLGVETLVQVFEPWLLRNIDLDHFAASRRYLVARASGYPDIEAARQAAIEHIPGTFSDFDKSVMESDLNQAKSVEAVLRVYLTYTGRRTFETVF